MCVCAGNGRSRCKWWEVFSPGSPESELQNIARQIMAIYDTTTTNDPAPTTTAAAADTATSHTAGDASASKPREGTATQREADGGKRSGESVTSGKEATKTDERAVEGVAAAEASGSSGKKGKDSERST